MSDLDKKIVDILPEFFNVNLQEGQFQEALFAKISQLIDFDFAVIFFQSPDNIRFKYSSDIFSKYNSDEIFEISDEIKTELFNSDAKVIDSKHQLIKLLGLVEYNSFLFSKLAIKNTVFGFILFCKAAEKNYSQTEIDAIKPICAIISYLIKDAELSGLFKEQLKMLAQSVVETKNAYQTIEEQNVKIIEADKVKTGFLANISHELRTPLNAIIGFSEILSEKLFGDLNAKQSEYIEDIRVSGVHLLEMINEILDIAKIEANAMSLNKSEFSLNLAVDEVSNILLPLFKKKHLSLEKNCEDIYIFADFQKIRQVLYNLLSNAIKFSNDYEKIVISTKCVGNDVTISVKDFGIGIMQEDAYRIFDKFVQLENTYTKKESSTGLGLTITKEFVQMHGGKIEVVSELNKGAEFIITLPMTL